MSVQSPLKTLRDAITTDRDFEVRQLIGHSQKKFGHRIGEIQKKTPASGKDAGFNRPKKEHFLDKAVQFSASKQDQNSKVNPKDIQEAEQQGKSPFPIPTPVNTLTPAPSCSSIPTPSPLR